MSGTSPRGARNVALDGLRGFAAMRRPAQPPWIVRKPGPKQLKQLRPGKFGALLHVFDPQLLGGLVDVSV